MKKFQKPDYLLFMILVIAAILIIVALAENAPASFRNNNDNMEAVSFVPEEDRYGGTLVIGTSNPPKPINPVITSNSVSITLINLLFDGLVRVNPNGDIEPCLARKWEISQDEKRYRFFLRDNVKFHDGKVLSAQDVIFTLEKFRTQKSFAESSTFINNIEKIEFVDDFIVDIYLKKRMSQFLYKLDLSILPKHILNDEDIMKTSFNYYPVGSGSFKFKSWDRKTNEIILEAHKGYFEGRPYLDEITVKTYSDNDALWAGIMRQEVDLVKFISSDNYRILKEDGSFDVHEIIGGIYYGILWNSNNNVLVDRETRVAIAQAIDVQKIIDSVYYGEGFQSLGPNRPDMPWFNKEVKPILYEPFQAKETLLKKGWKDVDGDGILEKNGKKFILNILVYENNFVVKSILINIRQQLAQVGVAVKAHLYSFEEEINGDYIEKYKIDGWLRYFYGSGFNSENYDSALQWSKNSSKYGKYFLKENKRINNLIEHGIEVKEKAKRIPIFKEFHKEVYEEQPACFLFYPSGKFAISKKFMNVEEYFNSRMSTYTIKNWYISQ